MNFNALNTLKDNLNPNLEYKTANVWYSMGLEMVEEAVSSELNLGSSPRPQQIHKLDSRKRKELLIAHNALVNEKEQMIPSIVSKAFQRNGLELSVNCEDPTGVEGLLKMVQSFGVKCRSIHERVELCDSVTVLNGTQRRYVNTFNEISKDFEIMKRESQSGIQTDRINLGLL